MRAAYADTLSESHDKLKRLVKLMDYSDGPTFLSIRPELQTTIMSGVQEAAADVLSNAATLLYYLPRERALEFDDT